MLELEDACDKLRQADILIAAVKAMFITAGYVQGARFMNAVIGLIKEEVSALEKAIAKATP